MKQKHGPDIQKIYNQLSKQTLFAKERTALELEIRNSSNKY